MRPLNVVIAQLDAREAEVLAALLHSHFRSVGIARSLEELRSAIPKHRADVVIVDLELVPLPDLEELHEDFGDTCIVCTHRVPDEEMWTDALAAGATDVCDNSDLRGIVVSALRSVGQMASVQAA